METEITWSWRSFAALAPAELYAIMALRQRVFVVEQACVYLDADGLDDRCWHLLGQAGGALLAYARLLPPGLKLVEPSIGRVVTAPEARGRGLGRTLMERALAEAAGRWPGQPVRIAAQLYLEPFYRDLGFATIGTPYDDDGIAHVDMVRG